MHDSMVEADIHRLSKAAAGAKSSRERREILALPEQKLAVRPVAAKGGPESATMAERSPRNALDYHLQRARAERDVAYRSSHALAADAHMRLSALHMERALLLQAVQRDQVGNVHPLPSNVRAPAIPALALPIVELPSAR